MRLRLRLPHFLARRLPASMRQPVPVRRASLVDPEAAAQVQQRARAMGLAPLAVDDFPAMRGSRRVLLAGLAVTTAALVVWVMIERPGVTPGPDPRLLQDDVKRCAPGQTTGCVGGALQVIVPSTGTGTGTGTGRGPGNACRVGRALGPRAPQRAGKAAR